MSSTYITSRYVTTDRERVRFLVERFPFATLIPERCPGDLLFVPLTVEDAIDHDTTLIGHADRANPRVGRLRNGSLHAVFHGPNAYISPGDYVTDQYPTWNYASAQLACESTLIHEPNEKRALMLLTLDRFEAHNGTSCRVDTRTRAFRSLLNRIVFFRLRVVSASAVLKFSQDKSETDRARAQQRLLHKISVHNERAMPRLAGDLEVAG